MIAGGASTQSRGRRPLPEGVSEAITLETIGAMEKVEFHKQKGGRYTKWLLSWVIGQSGVLWGGGPFPKTIESAIARACTVSGSYGNKAEHNLFEALEMIYNPLMRGSLSARFFQSGGEALAAAARIARQATGREPIASYGYHGAQLDFVHEPAVGGIPLAALDLHRRFEFGDVLGMREAAKGSAAIVVEVPGWDNEFAIEDFLKECQRAAKEIGAIFILDEVVTGFRLALAGAAERYRVIPDIVCLGKAMSGTGCVSAVLGREELVGKLADAVFYSTTFGGSPGPAAIAAATVKYLFNHWEKVHGHIEDIGNRLKNGLGDLGLECVGQAERSSLAFSSEDLRRAFCSAMIAEGIVVDRPFFPIVHHTLKDVDDTLAAAGRIIESPAFRAR